MIEMHLTDKDNPSLRGRVGKVRQANRTRKQADIAIPVSEKVDLRPKPPRRDKEGHLFLIKRTIHQNDIKF